MQLPSPRSSCSYALASDSFLASGYKFKIEFELVLQSQCSPCKRNRLDPVVRLSQREFTGDAQHGSHVRNAGVKGMGLRNAVKHSSPVT